MNSPELFPHIDTPALLVEVDALERNLLRMSEHLKRTGCGIRPHFKAHRMLEVCRRQISHGAHGITCAKLSEAEVLAHNGVDHLLIANQVVGPHKWWRLGKLARTRRVTVAIDNLEVAKETAKACLEHHASAGFVVDLDVGLNRCGVTPGAAAVELALRADELKGLRFRGLMAYEGHAVTLPGDEKEAACEDALDRLLETAELCREAGLPAKVITAGGTGTWDLTSSRKGVTEIQAGTYALMDLLFKEQAAAPFELACTVLATVISRPSPDRAIIDTGKKSLHPSFGMARPVDLPGATLEVLYSEHGALRLEGEAQRLRVGDRVRLLPYYGEGTVNLFDRAYAVRGNEAIGEWEVTGHNCSR